MVNMVNTQQIVFLAEKLGWPFPQNEQEVRMLIDEAASRKGLTRPQNNNEERMLLESWGCPT